MNTFGRGCLYIIIGFVLLFIFAFVAGRAIHIPWFVTVPLIVLAFWAASQRKK